MSGGIVVVDQRSDWPVDIPGVDVVTAWDYLTDDDLHPSAPCARLQPVPHLQLPDHRLLRLAARRRARPQGILPDITTVQDLKLAESPSVLNDEIEELIQQSLARLGSSEYMLNVYFGESPYIRHERLARALFNLFPAPLMQAKFVWRGDEWRVDTLGAVALGEVPAAHHEFLYQTAREYFTRRRAAAPQARFDPLRPRHPGQRGREGTALQRPRAQAVREARRRTWVSRWISSTRATTAMSPSTTPCSSARPPRSTITPTAFRAVPRARAWWWSTIPNRSCAVPTRSTSRS